MKESLTKESFIELMKDLSVQKRFRKNLEHLMKELGIWDDELSHEKLCQKLADHVPFHFVYAEQALHGHPVYKHLAELCARLGSTPEAMLHIDLAVSEPAVAA